MSILGDRTDKARFAASTPFLVSVALVAAVNIVLFSVTSVSLLGARRETPIQSQSHNSHPENEVVGARVSLLETDASPVPAQTNSPSPGNADMSSSTLVPPSSGMPTEETLPAPALKPSPDEEASTTAVETSNGSTRAPSTDEPPSPELSPSQAVRAPPVSTRVISHEQRDQLLQNFELQRHHANLDESSVAFVPGIHDGSSAGPESKPPVRHAASRSRSAPKPTKTANQLNQAEFRRLVVQGSGVLR